MMNIKRERSNFIMNLHTFFIFQMNLGLYNTDYDSDGRYVEAVRGLDDSRLLDAAETLVTLQTSDLGAGSNNPLFGSSLSHGAQEDQHAGNGGGSFQTVGGLSGRGGHQGGHGHQTMENAGQGGGGGRGRGKRGPSKRGRKKVGEGRGGIVGVGGEIAQQEEGMIETDNLQEMVPTHQPVEPMLKVGPLALRASILDQVLSEKKAQLMEDPDIIEFMRQHGIKH